VHVHVIAVGKIKDAGVRAWIDDYAKRIGRYADYHELELKDGELSDVEERFRKAIPARARVVALEVEGHACHEIDLTTQPLGVRKEERGEGRNPGGVARVLHGLERLGEGAAVDRGSAVLKHHFTRGVEVLEQRGAAGAEALRARAPTRGAAQRGEQFAEAIPERVYHLPGIGPSSAMVARFVGARAGHASGAGQCE